MWCGYSDQECASYSAVVGISIVLVLIEFGSIESLYVIVTHTSSFYSHMNCHVQVMRI